MNQREKDTLQLVLDYVLGLDDVEQRDLTEALLREDEQAQAIYANLQGCLRPLDALDEVEVPSGLADRTLAFIDSYVNKNAVRVARSDTETGYERRERVSWLWSSFSDVIAVAASIVLIMVFLPQGMHYARQRSQQAACATQLHQVGQAFADYAEDYDGYLPFVSRGAGERWCDVGRPGSNTRNVFLLVKDDYIPAGAFVCPGAPQRRVMRVTIDPQQKRAMVDFQRRNEISYSSRLITAKNHLRLSRRHDELLVADQNPLFADTYQPSEIDLYYHRYLMSMNSPNHGGAGQNVLRADSTVNFLKERLVGQARDDIYTIESVMRYRGVETPESAADIFIAP